MRPLRPHPPGYEGGVRALKDGGLLLGIPTYNMRPVPRIEERMPLLENKLVKEHLLPVFGSNG